MSKEYGRIHRLLRILTLIQSGSNWNAERLAEECGTTLRTIYRDMKMLEGAGIPYFHDPQTNGYRIRRDFFMPPVELTLDESLALIALANEIGGREQIPFMRAATKAIAKIKSQLPSGVRRELAELDDHIDIRLTKASSEDGILDVYGMTQQAIARKQALRCSYESAASKSNGSADDGEIFLFKPYCLFWGERAWYAVGHHDGRGAIRKLKLNRFTRIEPTETKYTIPKSFSMDAEIGNAWRMIRGARTYKVELWFAPEFAETIADTHWHQTQEIVWQDDASILFNCEVDGLDEIVWWVLSMGPHCQVRKPKMLADRVCKLARELVAVYEP